MARSRIVNLANFNQFTAINLLSDGGAIGGPVIIPSCAQIVIRFGLESGKTGHCVLYGRYSGTFAGSVTQANAILAALTTGSTWTAMAAFMATSTSVAGVDIRDVNTPNNAIVSSNAASVPGTSASPALPNESAIALTFGTGFAGPQFRGRMYVPGFATNGLGAGNVIAAALVTAMQNWGSTVRSAINANGYTHVIGQKARKSYTGSTGTVHPARAANSVTITNVFIKDNHWDSQRRRGLK